MAMKRGTVSDPVISSVSSDLADVCNDVWRSKNTFGTGCEESLVGWERALVNAQKYRLAC